MTSSSQSPEFRNIFAYDDEPEYWKKATSGFPNHVPRFDNSSDAMAFTEKYCVIGSNKDEPHLKHNITTMTSWEQIEKYILPYIRKYNLKSKDIPYNANINNNKYVDKCGDSKNKVHEYLQSRLNLPIHSKLHSMSTMNTFHYLFYHMKCGILVMIRNRQVVLFCPFVNRHYINNWNDYPDLDCTYGNNIEQYYIQKHSDEKYLSDKSKWWANGNIICNVEVEQYWGDHFLFQLKDMIVETCNQRIVPDCDFFINKRDYPQLKYNTHLGPVEPYGFIYNKDDRRPEEDIILSRHNYLSYTPILSFYSSERFADIPIPPSEDWEAATGQVYPSSFIHSVDEHNKPIIGKPRDLFTNTNLDKFKCTWQEKVPTAFFRGTATGGGTTIETNQRLHIAQICYDWSFIPQLAGKSHIDGSSDTSEVQNFPYLDAKITGWNMRDKKIATSKMTYVKKDQFKFNGDRKTNFVEIYKQSRYKYLLYIEGHCAACRYGFMMLLGSVILKVDSICVADQMWYFPLLKPYYDHIPVKADLSDLQEKIEWCRTHDIECQQIASNALSLYSQYINREGILDYMQSIFIGISQRFVRPPMFTSHVPAAVPPPYLPYDNPGCCHYSGECCKLCRKRKLLSDQQQMNISNEKTEKIDKEKSIEEARKKRKEMKKLEARELLQKRRNDALKLSSHMTNNVVKK